MMREVMNPEGSKLNIMRIKFEKKLSGDAHFNKDRDEAVILLRGELVVYIEEGSNVSKQHLRKPGDTVFIEKNKLHQFNILADDTEIIEAIEGVFEPGLCVKVNKTLIDQEKDD